MTLYPPLPEYIDYLVDRRPVRRPRRRPLRR
jgi:hypothetical protein